MRVVAASLLSVALLGCFPHNQKMRTYSKLTEGGLIAAGIGLEFIANSRSGADCDVMETPGSSASGCRTTGAVVGGIGLGMILAGITGFIATVSTAEDDKAALPPIEIKASTEKPAVKLPPGVAPTPVAATQPAAAATTQPTAQ